MVIGHNVNNCCIYWLIKTPYHLLRFSFSSAFRAANKTFWYLMCVGFTYQSCSEHKEWVTVFVVIIFLNRRRVMIRFGDSLDKLRLLRSLNHKRGRDQVNVWLRGVFIIQLWELSCILPAFMLCTLWWAAAVDGLQSVDSPTGGRKVWCGLWWDGKRSPRIYL